MSRWLDQSCCFQKDSSRSAWSVSEWLSDLVYHLKHHLIHAACRKLYTWSEVCVRCARSSHTFSSYKPVCVWKKHMHQFYSWPLEQLWRSSHICWALVWFSFVLWLNSSQTIWTGWLWRPGYLIQPSSHSPCLMVLLSTNQMIWRVAAGCCGRHGGSVLLQFWINGTGWQQKWESTDVGLIRGAVNF